MMPDAKTVREAGMPCTLGLGGGSYGYGRGYGREGDGPPGAGAGQAREARGGHTGHDSPSARRAGAPAAAKGHEVKGAATITATYRREGRGFQVLVRPKNARRFTRMVKTEQDAKDLVHHFSRLGMAGADLSAALAEARAAGQREYPPLREVLGPFLDDQVALGNIRAATAAAYSSRAKRSVPFSSRSGRQRSPLRRSSRPGALWRGSTTGKSVSSTGTA
jgi:hypothetical protein